MSSDAFRLTADLLPEPMLLVSAVGIIEAVNPGFTAMFGWPAPALVAQTAAHIVDTGPQEFVDYLRRCAGTRQMLPGAVNLRHRDGTVVQCRCQGGVFRPSAEGQAALVLLRVIPREQASTRFIALTRKVNELSVEVARRRAAEEAAAAANRLKDEFLATLSHELRTPLNAILGWTQVALRGGLTGDRLEQAFRTIQRNANAQSRMVDDLLEVSGAAQGKLQLEMRVVSLPHIVNDALDAVQLAAAQGEISLEVSAVPVADVIGDAHRLQQVVANLLSNAIKFTPPGGQVQVALAQRDASVRLTVSDTGEGISADFLPLVFDRFRQGDASTTRRHGGLGIGLALVKELVELHGGSVRIESGGVGQGTTATVELPAVEEPQFLTSA